jgi:uncharacterized protein (DUF58 family)
MAGPLLTPELLRALERFELLASRRASSSSRGERRSRARGQSVEFADHRNYTHGDDFRYLDWNLFGRLERLFLKLFEEERELPVRVFLDASESMTFGKPAKFDFARQTAAAIGYVALAGFDRLGIHLFPARDDLSEAEITARLAMTTLRGKKSSFQFFKHIQLTTAGGSADLNASLRRFALEARHPGLAVVLSDFLDPAGYEAGMGALVARGFQVDAIQILAPEELNPTAFGDLKLVDSETGDAQEVTFGRYRLKAYTQSVARYIKRLEEFCLARGITFFSVSSDARIEDFLLKQLRRSEVWG